MAPRKLAGIIFYVLDATTKFDNVEIHPIKGFGNDAGTCEDTPEEADYWTVQIHLTEGGLQDVADCPTIEEAKALQRLLIITGLQQFRTDVNSVANRIFYQIKYQQYLKERMLMLFQSTSDDITNSDNLDHEQVKDLMQQGVYADRGKWLTKPSYKVDDLDTLIFYQQVNREYHTWKMVEQ